MMRKAILSFALCAPLAITACTTDVATEEVPPQAAPEQDRDVAESVVHDVMCGCSIDGVGACGNYIKIDGRYVPMIHPRLGKMEWCAQKSKGAKVETIGEMKGGKFVAKEWKTVE